MTRSQKQCHQPLNVHPGQAFLVFQAVQLRCLVNQWHWPVSHLQQGPHCHPFASLRLPHFGLRKDSTASEHEGHSAEARRSPPDSPQNRQGQHPYMFQAFSHDCSTPPTILPPKQILSMSQWYRQMLPLATADLVRLKMPCVVFLLTRCSSNLPNACLCVGKHNVSTASTTVLRISSSCPGFIVILGPPNI